jgi:hypothetical protein
MKQQFQAMLEMQDAMNRRVHDDWIERDFEWYRALWIECGELIDHYGYKWWKKQTADMEQVQLEVIDIWHFGMSMLFDGRNIEQIAEDLCKQLDTEAIPEADVLRAAEVLACHTLAKREGCWGFPLLRFRPIVLRPPGPCSSATAGWSF